LQAQVPSGLAVPELLQVTELLNWQLVPELPEAQVQVPSLLQVPFEEQVMGA
jgi:hypothetical protein